MRIAGTVNAIVVLLGSVVLVGAGPPPVSLTDVGVEAELHETTVGGIVPAWLDLDGDLRGDPVWFTYEGVFTLVEADEGWILEEIEVPPTVQPGGGAPQPLLAVLDADGDGTNDLMVLHHQLQFLRVVAPRKLELIEAVLPAVPAGSGLDAAVGDLNADGRTDLILSFGLLSLEIFSMAGHRDVVLMNRGNMRFEIGEIEPSRSVYTHGITLADMDGDLQPDLVESIDFSHFDDGKRLARILLNRTPPGAAHPVFEVAEHTYDTGTFGMGAAVGDVNEDGFPDIYNTSWGLDLMVLGRPDGSFEDVTLSHGFLHDWSQDGLRLQWCASFADMNLDGRLDVVARYGGENNALPNMFGGGEGGGMMGDMQDMEPMEGMGGMMEGMDADSDGPTDLDILYLQRPDGTFERVHVPYDPAAGDEGRHAVVGDINGDHIPDVALGGKGGSAGFWLNQTPPPEGGVQIRVDLRPTVTGWPAAGAKVVGTCADEVQSRMQTTGGKEGGVQDMALFMAWPDCDDDPVVQVFWPSGAQSTHMADEEGLVDAGEPLWWMIPEDAPGLVRLDPIGAGAGEACVSASGGPWDCCSPDGESEVSTCDLPIPEGPGLVRLDERSAMALPETEAHWFVETVPSPPVPGQSAEIHVMYAGSDEAFQEAPVSLFVNGVTVPWAYTVDEEKRRVAIMDIPEESTSLDVTLYPLDMPPQATWVLPTGVAYDSRWCEVYSYPYQVHGGVTEFWQWSVYLTGIRAKPASVLLPGLVLEKADGSEMEGVKVMSPDAVTRVRALLSNEELAGTSSVILRDSLGAFTWTLPAPQPVTMEEAVSLLGPVAGGLVRWRVVGGGDVAPLMLALRDGEGRVMPPEAELVTFEVDGGELSQELDLLPGGYNMQAMLTTDPGTGPGEVRVIGLDGRILGRFTFERRAPGLTQVGIETSMVNLVEASAMAPEGATHQVMVSMKTPFGETIVADTLVEVEIEGGVLLEGDSSMEVDPDMMGEMGMGGMDMESMGGGGIGGGSMMSIRADPGKHPLVVSVTVNGTAFPVMSMDVDIPLPVVPPEPPGPETPEEEETVVPSETVDDGAPEETEPTPSSQDSGGCAGAPSPWNSATVCWLLLVALVLYRRRAGLFIR